MPLRIYNTLTRRKEDFPKKPGERVTMYVCGPTVYKPSHIGHMVGPVIFDTVKRYLTFLGYKAEWVVNITDVDDKLIVRAKELNTTVPALAAKMTADYLDCLKKLNVTGIDQMPKATEHIPGMLQMISDLIAKGCAYPAGGDVYFDVSKDDDYGKLCNRDPEQLEAGARIEVSDRKRNPGDFALWKGAKPGEPKEVVWESPWGPGRPGWHIECSVMSQALLGKTIDIHGGGLDLQFPHHENELAQSESATGETFARFWMHNGLLKMGSAKMAGSVGNVVNIADLLQKHDAETVRFLLLSTHYRSPIEYSDERLIEVGKALQSFYRFFERYQRITGKQLYDLRADLNLDHHIDRQIQFVSSSQLLDNVKQFVTQVTNLRSQFLEHMNDDFNTGGAVGVLFELVSALNHYADQRHLEEQHPPEDVIKVDFILGVQVLRQLSAILGLFHTPLVVKAANDELVGGLMKLLIDLRADARKAKNFAVGDQIRQRLAELKITLEDRPGGATDWRVG